MTPRKPLHAATALATSLALVLPPLPVLAQDVDPALREQCLAEGVPDDAALLAVCAEAIAAGGDGAAAAQAAAGAPAAEAAPVEVEVEDGADVDVEAADEGTVEPLPGEQTAEPTVAPAAEAASDSVEEDLPGTAADALAEDAAAPEEGTVQATEAPIEAPAPAAGDGTPVETQAAEGETGAEALQAAPETDAGGQADAEGVQPVQPGSEEIEALRQAEGTDTAAPEAAGDAAAELEALDEDAADAALIPEGGAEIDAGVEPGAGVEGVTDVEALNVEETEEGADGATDAGGVTTPEADASAQGEPAPNAAATAATAQDAGAVEGEPQAAAAEPCPPGTVSAAEGGGCVPAPEGETAGAPIPESEIAEGVETLEAEELTDRQRRAAEQASNALQALDGLLGGGTAAGDAASALEAPPAAAATASEDGGEVTEQTFAAGDLRTSSEDFATDAIVTDQATATAAQEEDDGGLSRNQRIALGALGALAVGTVLANQARVVSNSGDRVVVQRADGDLTVLKDDDALLRQAGANVRTQTFDDGSTRSIVTREDGSQVITVRDASLRVLRRVLLRPDGTELTLIDDTRPAEPVRVDTLPQAPVVATARAGGTDALGAALAREQGLDRRFSLSQVRQIPEVRALAPAIEVNAVTFESGSAAIQPDQAEELTGLAQDMLAAISADPRAVYLIEGHTDATGDAALNLALSDRRAESLALALNEYFGVPVENMVVQGYGERYLKIPTQTAERANRRAVAREITGLLQTAAAN